MHEVISCLIEVSVTTIEWTRLIGRHACSRKGVQNMEQEGIEKRTQKHKEERVLVAVNAERGETPTSGRVIISAV